MRNVIKEMNDKHRSCRLYGHPWAPTTVEKEGTMFIQGLRCERCDTERKVHIPARGERFNRYKAPKEYRVEGGMTAKDRHDLWRFEARTQWK